MEASKWAKFSVCTGEKVSTSRGNDKNDHVSSHTNQRRIYVSRSHALHFGVVNMKGMNEVTFEDMIRMRHQRFLRPVG